MSDKTSKRKPARAAKGAKTAAAVKRRVNVAAVLSDSDSTVVERSVAADVSSRNLQSSPTHPISIQENKTMNNEIPAFVKEGTEQFQSLFADLTDRAGAYGREYVAAATKSSDAAYKASTELSGALLNAFDESVNSVIEHSKSVALARDPQDFAQKQLEFTRAQGVSAMNRGQELSRIALSAATDIVKPFNATFTKVAG